MVMNLIFSRKLHYSNNFSCSSQLNHHSQPNTIILLNASSINIRAIRARSAVNMKSTRCCRVQIHYTMAMMSA